MGLKKDVTDLGPWTIPFYQPSTRLLRTNGSCSPNGSGTDGRTEGDAQLLASSGGWLK